MITRNQFIEFIKTASMQKQARPAGRILFNALGLGKFYSKHPTLSNKITRGGILSILGLGGFGAYAGMNAEPIKENQNFINYLTESYNNEHPDDQKPYVNLGSPWRGLIPFTDHTDNSQKAVDERKKDTDYRYWWFGTHGNWKPKDYYHYGEKYTIPEGADVIPVEDYLNQRRPQM